MSFPVVEASDDLTRAVRVSICRQMAQALMNARTDLADDDAVIDALLDAGFDGPSVKSLWQDARKLADAFSIPTEGSA